MSDLALASLAPLSFPSLLFAIGKNLGRLLCVRPVAAQCPDTGSPPVFFQCPVENTQCPAVAAQCPDPVSGPVGLAPARFSRCSHVPRRKILEIFLSFFFLLEMRTSGKHGRGQSNGPGHWVRTLGGHWPDTECFLPDTGNRLAGATATVRALGGHWPDTECFRGSATLPPRRPRRSGAFPPSFLRMGFISECLRRDAEAVRKGEWRKSRCPLGSK